MQNTETSARAVNLLEQNDEGLLSLSRENLLALNLEEMKAVQKHFRELGRNPTDVEIETIAQTWSEHCKHKTLRGIIEYSETSPDRTFKKETIDDLLKETIIKATKKLKSKLCISVFKDNAGIISFDKDTALAFKVETHNHPSALEPYGGAGTGIGGVIRDILGAGLGARPVANTDVFCFGSPDTPFSSIPDNVLHPKRIAKGVVAGVRDYGNRMGIPTVNGAVIFDEGYTYNPLVYCGTVGILPKKHCFKKVKPGDLIVAAGGRTGRDGIHGATFSSIELDKETAVSAVQIGNPIVEKKLADTLLAARDAGLYRAVTDCGAGGFSSAVGELAEGCGARVFLEKAPLKYAGLMPWEIWLSESQERMVFAVAPANLEKMLGIFSGENVEAVVIGEFTGTGRLEIFFKNEKIAGLDLGFLHKGIPRKIKKASWTPPVHAEPANTLVPELSKALLTVLSDPTVASKEWIIRQYDHEVQGGSIIKPLVGAANDGPGDAAVVRPYLRSWKGFALANGINPRYGLIDPYWMTASAVDEALRNITCVGGDIRKAAILDNFCWGNPDRENILGEIVRASMACRDASLAFKVPFISGKDSLNNEYSEGGKSRAVPGTMLISAISVIDDVRKCVTMDAKKSGNLIYLLGETFSELGGSHYYKVAGLVGNGVPKVDFKKAAKLMVSLRGAVSKGLVRSCHDLSEGGLAVAAAEMAFAGGLGVELDLRGGNWKMTDMNAAAILFSESNSRFLVEIEPGKKAAFERALKGNSFARAGKVRRDGWYLVRGLSGETIIKEKIQALREAWQKKLRW